MRSPKPKVGKHKWKVGNKTPNTEIVSQIWSPGIRGRKYCCGIDLWADNETNYIFSHNPIKTSDDWNIKLIRSQ